MASTDTLTDHIPAGKPGQLCELSRPVNGTVDLTRAQNAILAGAQTLTLADYGSIQLFEQDGSGTVNLDRREGSVEGDLALKGDELVAPRVARQGTLLRRLDLASDERFPGARAEGTPSTNMALGSTNGLLCMNVRSSI